MGDESGQSKVEKANGLAVPIVIGGKVGVCFRNWTIRIGDKWSVKIGVVRI